MSKVFMFPGLNGLLKKADRMRYANQPNVQRYFQSAEIIIGDKFNKKISFLDFLNESTEYIYSVDNISLAAVAICSIQGGVSEAVASEFGKPDWVIGCSLGDLGRSVFANAYSFEDAVTNHIKFTQKIDGIDKIGKNIGVLATKTDSFSEEDYQWFSDIKVDVSRLTPRFLNIGGRFEDLKKIEEKAIENSWGTMTLLEYPAHSRYILPYVEAVRQDFQTVKTHSPKIKMFSSLSAVPISDPEIIREEFLLSITRPIHWCQAIERLHLEHGASEFINIGPCRSLSKMMRDIPVEVTVTESYDILN
jgi:[acyl-carrier-protein] S-malonyltransferase